MPLRKRNSPAPYQVMRAFPNASGSAARRSEPVATPRTPAAVSQWSPVSQGPSTVRLPRGYVILAIVGIVALLSLAYWAGSRHTPTSSTMSEEERLANTPAHLPDELMKNAAAFPPASQPRGKGLVADPVRPAGVLLETGKYYMVLASTTNGEYCKPLLRFLIAKGVDVAAIKRNNDRFFRVVALRGFTPEERDGPQKLKFERDLKTLGREWKNQYRGQSDLGDMYLDPQPYKGEKIAQSITKEDLP